MTDRWVVQMHAWGPNGQMKMAMTVGEVEPGFDKLAEMNGKINGYYRVNFGDYPEHYTTIKKNDATAKVATFTY